MKKTLLCASLALVTVSSMAQTWTGTTTSGLVGIGVTSPVAKLEIKTVYTDPSLGQPFPTQYPGIKINHYNGGVMNLVEVNASPTPTGTPSKVFSIRADGMTSITKSLRIGSAAANGVYANYKLSVDGDMIAKRCVIQVSDWADYVFDKNYALLSLDDVASYVQVNKHLPGVPSEAEIKKNGIEVGEMNKILMQKIEEFTLYMIDLKKQNDQLRLELNELKRKN